MLGALVQLLARLPQRHFQAASAALRSGVLCPTLRPAIFAISAMRSQSTPYCQVLRVCAVQSLTCWILNLDRFHLGASCLRISSNVPSSVLHIVCSSIRHLDCCLFTPRLRGGACMPLRRQYSALVDEKSDESELPRAAVIFLSYSYIRLISSFVAACPLRALDVQPSR
jgi:hypothetical protein